MDFAFYELSGVREINRELLREYAINNAGDALSAKDPLQIICGKVLKYLLTARGSDAYDPTYGSRALHRTHVAPSLVPEIRMELLEDIHDCVTYLRTAENAKLSTTAERLYSVQLIDLHYNRTSAPDRLDVHLLIRSNQGRTAVIKVTT